MKYKNLDKRQYLQNLVSVSGHHNLVITGNLLTHLAGGVVLFSLHQNKKINFTFIA